ncbi:Pentatricopeptide repeat-containing protein, chloroplastic [Glycine soja]|nr:Pentatricopeptide repeat-containing protein, chloroplastic [Glycine soja]
MTQVFVEPDGYTFVALLSACSSFEDRLIGKVVHVLVYRKLDCLGGNVLLVNVEVARRFFDQMGGRDVVSWTAMISGYCHAGCFQEALELFVQLEELRMEQLLLFLRVHGLVPLSWEEGSTTSMMVRVGSVVTTEDSLVLLWICMPSVEG